MFSILSLSLADFLAQTAAKQPTPGGGSVAALAGALAASLASMAVEYTLGKKSFVAYDDELRRALASFHASSTLLQELISEDIAAYEALSACLKLPADLRQKSPDYLPAVVAAIRAPQTAAGIAMNILTLCTTLLDKSNKYLISDLGIAAVYAHATVHASQLNVAVNLPLLPSQEEAASMRNELQDLANRADTLYAGFRDELLRRL
jgi:formiminotetrahydrofolate cyclodeaminase